MAISAVALGRRLKLARLKKGYTQEYVAEKVELSVPHLSRIENGRKSVYVNKLGIWCDLLDVSVEEILGGAVIPENLEYNRQFISVAKDCSKETINDMLEMCSRMAEIERRARGEERK